MRVSVAMVLALAVMLAGTGAHAALSLSLRSSFTRTVAETAAKLASSSRGGVSTQDVGASCSASLCNALCPQTSHTVTCCNADTCFYDTFWVNWSCCGGDSSSSDSNCCGKLTGGAIAVIVVIVVAVTAGICACVYCCCCRQRPVVVTGTTTAYVVMPNGQAQPVVPGQPIVYYQGAGVGAQTTGGASVYAPPPQQFHNPAAAPAYTS